MQVITTKALSLMKRIFSSELQRPDASDERERWILILIRIAIE